MIWIIYYLLLFLLAYILINLITNKFIKYFFIPILIGSFGSFWFIQPGSSELAPIVSILFLEASILDSNGTERLIRPMLGFIFILEIISLIFYFLSKNLSKKE